MRKKTLKGFTLLELIIVLAVFSIIMVGAMSLVDPASKIHSRASNNENSYAYVDNIQNYLQDSLEYADHLWVYQGNMTDDQLSKAALDFKNTYYVETENIYEADGVTLKETKYYPIVTKKDEDSAAAYADCRIRVMTILNSDTAGYKKGQILQQTVNYKSSDYANGLSYDSLSAAEPQLNDAYFQDTYAFDYVLGSGTLVKHNTDMLALDTLTESSPADVPAKLNPSNFAITIIAYRTKADRNGQVALPSVANSGDPSEYIEYMDYPSTTHYYVANIPLFNIIQRNGMANTRYWVSKVADLSTAEHISSSGISAFHHYDSDISMHCEDNIYIIYSMADEIV